MKKLLLTLVVLLPLFAHTQSKDKIQISGKVLSSELKPMEGVSVFVSLPNGNSAGGQTYKNGDFAIPILVENQNQVYIRLSYLGFLTVYDTLTNADFTQHKTYFMHIATRDLDAVNITSSVIAEVDAPIVNQTLNKADIESKNLGQDIPVILNNTPSLVVTSDAGAGIGYSALRIRGSDQTRINITVNGIPLNDAEAQGVFFVNMPDFASSATRIDIQRGVGASTNGAGAFGANINLETFDRSTHPYFELNNSFGSFETYKNTAVFSTGLINNRWKMNGRLSQISSQGYIDRASSNLKSYYLDATYQSLNKKFMLDAIHFSGSERTYQSWWGTPESRVIGDVAEMNAYADRNFLTPEQRQNLLNSGRTYNYYEYKNETDNYKQSHYQLHANYRISNKLKLSVSGFYVRGLGYFEQSMPGQSFSDYGVLPYVAGADTISQTDMVRQLWLDNHSFGAVYGLRYQNQKTIVQLGGSVNRYLGDHYDDVTWAQFSGNMPKDYRFASSFSTKNDFNNFVKITHELNSKLSLYGDLQLRMIHYRADGLDDNRVPFAFNQNYVFFNPKGGVNYAISQSSRIYFSVANAKREPVRMDFIESAPNIPKFENLIDYELGYQKRTRKYLLDVNLYYMDYRNQLVLTGEMNSVGGLIRKNAGRSFREGIELQGTYVINKRISLGANLNMSINRIKDYKEVVMDWYGVVDEQAFEYKNTPISFSPSVIAAAFTEVKPLKNLTVNISGKYVGKQYLDNSGSKESLLNAYTVVDLRMSYSIPNKLAHTEIVLLINNITNQMYSSNGYTYKYYLGSKDVLYTDKMLYPQAGINYLIGVNMKF